MGAHKHVQLVVAADASLLPTITKHLLHSRAVVFDTSSSSCSASAQHRVVVSLHLGSLQTGNLGIAGHSSPIATSPAAASLQREHAAALAVDADRGDEDYAGGLCIVCFDAHRSAVLAPCGHVAMCT